MKVRIKNPIWGVPITFLDKYNQEQFEIVGLTSSSKECTYGLLLSENQSTRAKINSKYIYARILIQKNKNENKN